MVRRGNRNWLTRGRSSADDNRGRYRSSLLRCSEAKTIKVGKMEGEIECESTEDDESSVFQDDTR